jgi:LacI family transcriptional regulator
MSKRPTIPDLAKAAGVSISTVNRVINDAQAVRQPTRERVMRAAQEIGFYGLGSIEHSLRNARETHRFGAVLLQESRPFYKLLGDNLIAEAKAHPDANIDLTLRYLDDLTPETVAQTILELGESCESLAIVSADHPIISDAISTVLANGTPVAALIGPLNAKGNVGYVGLDNYRKGRMAAWAFHKMVHEPGKIGLLVGNPRYRNQELNEAGFRSYFREHCSDFTVLEPLNTYESSAVARELVEKLLTDHPDLCGIFISGGGISGAIPALRALPRRKDFVAVGYELFDMTRSALIDGTLTLSLAHPMETFARETIKTLIRQKNAGPEGGAQRVMLDFDIYTSENV